MEKIISSMNLMLSRTKVIKLIPLPESRKKDTYKWTFGYNTNDYTLYFSNGDIYVDTNFGLFVADKINL